MKNHLVVSISALALAAALALPATAANVTGTLSGSSDTATGAGAGDGTGAGAAVDATTTASTSASGSFTVDNVLKDKPFGDIAFDQTKTPDEATMALSDAQKLEIQQRCDVVANNPNAYNNDTSLWCTTYLDWWKKNHPAG